MQSTYRMEKDIAMIRTSCSPMTPGDEGITDKLDNKDAIQNHSTIHNQYELARDGPLSNRIPRSRTYFLQRYHRVALAAYDSVIRNISRKTADISSWDVDSSG